MMVSDKRRILIVEDEEIRNVYGQVLVDGGFEVDMAVDGEEGLAKALEGGYSLILLDIKMPKVDGLEFLRRLGAEKTKERNGPVIVLTNYADSEMATGARMLGAAGYVIKANVDPGQFLTTIGGFLE